MKIIVVEDELEHRQEWKLILEAVSSVIDVQFEILDKLPEIPSKILMGLINGEDQYLILDNDLGKESSLSGGRIYEAAKLLGLAGRVAMASGGSSGYGLNFGKPSSVIGQNCYDFIFFIHGNKYLKKTSDYGQMEQEYERECPSGYERIDYYFPDRKLELLNKSEGMTKLLKRVDEIKFS